MVDIVTFKWRRPSTGYQLPSICDYTADHVNILHRSARLHGNFNRFILITDDPTGIDPDIEIMPLWDDYLSLGGCYNRMKVYSLLADKFLMVDLDCVITGSIQHLLDRPESVVLNRYCLPVNPRQFYNGALQLITPGEEAARIWYDFRPSVIPKLRHRGIKQYVGTDQAWLSYYLGADIPTFGPEDGIRDIRNIGVRLPDNTCIVFFHGAKDPSQAMNLPWVRDHWC